MAGKDGLEHVWGQSVIGFCRGHIARHRYFYLSALLGIAAWIAARATLPSLSGALAWDVFFCGYLVMMTALAFRITPDRLRKQAAVEDEGMIVIILVTLTAICVNLVWLFVLLNRGDKPSALLMALSIASAPLGWLMLHTVAAFHYAHLYYAAGDSNGARIKDARGLAFPGEGEPDSWDFLYFSFVIGMTAQVSDVQVTARAMRKVVLAHGVASFFFNTVLIALAVNIAVVLAQAPG